MNEEFSQREEHTSRQLFITHAKERLIIVTLSNLIRNKGA